jgi:hypothetical protein
MSRSAMSTSPRAAAWPRPLRGRWRMHAVILPVRRGFQRGRRSRAREEVRECAGEDEARARPTDGLGPQTSASPPRRSRATAEAGSPAAGKTLRVQTERPVAPGVTGVFEGKSRWVHVRGEERAKSQSFGPGAVPSDREPGWRVLVGSTIVASSSSGLRMPAAACLPSGRSPGGRRGAPAVGRWPSFDGRRRSRLSQSSSGVSLVVWAAMTVPTMLRDRAEGIPSGLSSARSSRSSVSSCLRPAPRPQS